jgi:hypothetical protein
LGAAHKKKVQLIRSRSTEILSSVTFPESISLLESTAAVGAVVTPAKRRGSSNGNANKGKEKEQKKEDIERRRYVVMLLLLISSSWSCPSIEVA